MAGGLHRDGAADDAGGVEESVGGK
jgi:hypothetical protein